MSLKLLSGQKEICHYRRSIMAQSHSSRKLGGSSVLIPDHMEVPEPMAKSSKKLKKAEKNLSKTMDRAKDWASPKLESALHWAEDSLTTGVEKATPYVSNSVESLADALQTARDKVTDEYAPAAAGQLATVAGKTSSSLDHAKVPAFVETTLAKVTGDKKAAKKLKKAASQYAKSTEKAMKKRSKRSRSGGKTLIVVGILAAAAAAGYAVWQLTQPVEDPWKNPTPQPLRPRLDTPTAGGNAVVDETTKPTV